MVKQLKRLFADAITSTPVGAQATSQPKEEPVFYNENNNSSVYYGNSRRRNWYRGNGGRNRRQNNPPQPKKEGNGMKGILNPVDRDGNITRCRTCDSKYHWQSECPVRSKTPDTITLFQSKNIDNEETKVFAGETINCAVLDSGCSQTICGKNWLSCFQGSLDEDTQIAEKASKLTFKFGNEDPVHSIKKVSFPVMIGK